MIKYSDEKNPYQCNTSCAQYHWGEGCVRGVKQNKECEKDKRIFKEGYEAAIREMEEECNCNDYDKIKERRRMRRGYEFMLALLLDIKKEIDSGNDIDLLQISVAITRLHDILGTEQMLNPNIKPGLKR